MDFLKRLNSRKMLRVAQFALFFAISACFVFAFVAQAISINEQVLIQSNIDCYTKGSTSLGCTSASVPMSSQTSSTKPKCTNAPAKSNQVGGGGVLDTILAAGIGYTVGFQPQCDQVTSSIGPNGQTLYTYQSTTGATQVLANYTARMIKDPPVSSTEYVAYVIDSFKHPFAEPAYAQGLGFSSLSPVLELWRAMRNLAYFFFVVIFIITGFMIMFRSKIGGKAAVTVQQALPKIIVSLLLVTFSYAIAGLMIDVMYLIIYLMIGIFTRSDIDGLHADDLAKLAFEGNIFSNALGLFSEGIIGSVAGALGNITVATLGLHPEDIGGEIVQGISNVIFTLVIAIALLVSVFRIFFALLKAYVGIFFSVIFGPIQLLIGALPGQDTFGAWIKGLFENLLVFPILTLLIILAHFFVKSSFIRQDQLGFSPPQLTSNQGTSGFAVFSGLIPLGVILAMPEVLKLAQGAMKGQIGVGFDDLKKNLEAGKAGAKRVALAPANMAAGAAIGAYAGKKLGGTTRAGVIGGVLGGAFGAATGAPMAAAGSIARSGGSLMSSFAALQAANLVKRGSQRAQIEKKRREASLERAKAAAARVPTAPANPGDFDPNHD